MGMYTEILVKADVNLSKLNDCDRSVLDYMFGDGKRPDVLPDHVFLNCHAGTLLESVQVFIITLKL